MSVKITFFCPVPGQDKLFGSMTVYDEQIELSDAQVHEIWNYIRIYYVVNNKQKIREKIDKMHQEIERLEKVYTSIC